ncbi:unnamed protein product [Aspergillus oryzae]|uniref:Unnamed protein product n=1 Tax=Aspergillus oryzae TaxID=5062 RepID=A0AAN4Y9U8_ASPOZ|nr:unnamed protein product [Aspergillus oryzae]
MSADSNSPRAIALRYISNSRFHRRYTLPATADHDSLTFTYADIGSTSSSANPNPQTILFMPGMFATRIAPWVDPSHSHVTSMQMAQYVPVKAFNVWNLIPKFLLLKAGPAFTSSEAAITKTSNVISSGSGFSSGGENYTELERNRRQIEYEYGLSRDVQAEIDSLIFQFMFEESTVGANSEALQCLRKGSDSSNTWGKCENYEAYVKELVDLEGRRHRRTGQEKLKVRAYFAGNDSMIGKAGQDYVEECWARDTREFKDALDFESRTFTQLEHDSLVQSAEVLKSIFLHVGGAMPNDTE